MNVVTILVVEDDEDIASQIQLTLEMEGYDARVTTSGEAALELLKQTRPDLVVADILMPGMDGYELYNRMRENPDWIAIPFVFLTALTAPEEVRRGKSVGVDDYLIKPFEKEELLAVVKGKLKRAAALQEVALYPAPLPPRTELKGLVVDREAHVIYVEGVSMALTPTEFTILSYLAHYFDRVVPGRELVMRTHDYECDEREARALIHPHVKNLRRKLARVPGFRYRIQTVRSTGFRLERAGDAG